VQGCIGFNIFFERSPSQETGPGCANPPSITTIRCVLWGVYLSPAGAWNTGQWCNDFQVIIAGSNGYMKTIPQQVDGFTVTGLKNAAINAPLDCNGADTHMGVKIFSGNYLDASLCAAACDSQNQYNTAHPPSTGKPKLCKLFTKYMVSKNGSPLGQQCALYSEPWDVSYATNTVRDAPSLPFSPDSVDRIAKCYNANPRHRGNGTARTTTPQNTAGHIQTQALQVTQFALPIFRI
jgi:hypothetical protein